MQDRIVITKYNNQYLVVFIKNNKAVKVRALSDIYEKSGKVYLGRVKNVKKNINASFVRYLDKIGFIEGCDRKPETVFPVSVKKETSDNKENELSDIITLQGLYVIISSSINGLRFSKRIEREFKNKYDFSELTNCIVRNNAVNVDYNSIYNEYQYLNAIYGLINNKIDTRTENTILYDGILKIVDLIFSENISEYSEILTDDAAVYSVLGDFFKEYEAHNIRINIPIRKYIDDIPLNLFISLSALLDRALNRKVYLNSDSYLIFDYTEALTVIDVNSGTTTLKGDKQSVIHKINMEACEEITAQLKLRNLSGIIIVDLINEKNNENYNELIDYTNKILLKDDCHAKCHGISSLGLMEITRARIEKPLKDQLWK